MTGQCGFDSRPVCAVGNAQALQVLFRIDPPGRVQAATVQQDAVPTLGQSLRRQEEPGVMAFLARIAGPIQVDWQARGVIACAEGFGETRQFFGAFLLVPQQHQEGAELGLFHFAVQQHAHGIASFIPGQATGAAFTFAEDADELGERVFGRGCGRHRQFVGRGRPASLAASLAGAPLKR